MKNGGRISLPRFMEKATRRQVSRVVFPSPRSEARGEGQGEGQVIKNSTPPRPNDSLAPARSALPGLCFANSFRRFPTAQVPRFAAERAIEL